MQLYHAFTPGFPQHTGLAKDKRCLIQGSDRFTGIIRLSLDDSGGEDGFFVGSARTACDARARHRQMKQCGILMWLEHHDVAASL